MGDCAPRWVGLLFGLSQLGLLVLCLILVRLAIKLVERTNAVESASIPWFVAIVGGLLSVWVMVDRMIAVAESRCGLFRDGDTMLFFLGYSIFSISIAVFFPMWMAYAWQYEKMAQYEERYAPRSWKG